jgi:hypothetical protein
VFLLNALPWADLVHPSPKPDPKTGAFTIRCTAEQVRFIRTIRKKCDTRFASEDDPVTSVTHLFVYSTGGT